MALTHCNVSRIHDPELQQDNLFLKNMKPPVGLSHWCAPVRGFPITCDAKRQSLLVFKDKIIIPPLPHPDSAS